MGSPSHFLKVFIASKEGQEQTSSRKSYLQLRGACHDSACPPPPAGPSCAETPPSPRRSQLLPGRPVQPDQNFPLGRGPAIRSGPGAVPCSSRVVGGAVLVSLPSLSGPERGMSLGQPGRGPDLPAGDRWGGVRRGDDSIVQGSALLSRPPPPHLQPLGGLPRPGKGERSRRPRPWRSGCGWDEPGGGCTGRPLRPAKRTPRPLAAFPQARSPGGWQVPPPHGGEAMEQFRAIASSCSSFPVIKRGAAGQWLLEMLHPRARTSRSLGLPPGSAGCSETRGSRVLQGPLTPIPPGAPHGKRSPPPLP
ncbi:basic proline-rich protein-like [Suncus etruscus]|uniref:basic proline-rich protein-like n=1 Tax=Suncus etruscus TaxID=109475 RepID=UPI00210F6A61|nr:basic proline-rich protein-like [Suncus etruscus]